MSDFFYCQSQGDVMQRKITGNFILFQGLGDFKYLHDIEIPAPYTDESLQWGTSSTEALPLALALLTHCLKSSHSNESTSIEEEAWRLHHAFAEEVPCHLNVGQPLSLDWFQVQSWIDANISGELGPLSSCIRRVREFERVMRSALDERTRHVDLTMWSRWDIATVASICIAGGHLEPQLLGKFVDHLLDLKFKIYCLLEVDLPVYTKAIECWKLDLENLESTPQGFVTRLSEEVTLIIK